MQRSPVAGEAFLALHTGEPGASCRSVRARASLLSPGCLRRAEELCRSPWTTWHFCPATGIPRISCVTSQAKAEEAAREAGRPVASACPSQTETLVCIRLQLLPFLLSSEVTVTLLRTLPVTLGVSSELPASANIKLISPLVLLPHLLINQKDQIRVRRSFGLLYVYASLWVVFLLHACD